MRNLLIYISLISFLFLVAGCTKKDKDRYYGVDTIDNKLYGVQTYYALGFLFDEGTTTSTLELPAPDITIHVSTDLDGNITSKYINTPNLIESFALAGSYDSSSQAKEQFGDLLEVGERDWLLFAAAVEENQIWIFKTIEGNYVKIRIIELVTDNSVNPPYVQMKFEWRMQPGGLATFDS